MEVSGFPAGDVKGTPLPKNACPYQTRFFHSPPKKDVATAAK